MTTRSFVGTLAVVIMLLPSARPATVIEVSDIVVMPQAKRMGLNLGSPDFWDSGQMTKMLVFRNPGFEGELYQSTVRCATSTATTCIDDYTTTAWPSGFWNGATFEFIWGGANGRTGTIATSTAPSGSTGTTYQFSASGVAAAPGDYMVLRKSTAGGAEQGWWPTTTSGGVIGTELSDLPPGTLGRQALRMSAAAGESPSLASFFDSTDGRSFLQLNGNYRLTFKAKGVSGSNQLRVVVRRFPSAILDNTITLSGSWTDYTFDFARSENGSVVGTIELRFSTVGPPDTVLLDDVSLVPIGGDPTNTTIFRDEVVDTLRAFRPGILRYMEYDHNNGETLDNQLAPVFGRLRSGYRLYSTGASDVVIGLHEFLELCELVGAEPWYVFPVTSSTTEMANLMEYLGGPAGRGYGAVREARGHAAPWTDTFPRIHLEFGNETWNGSYNGGTIGYPIPYANRGSELFGVAKASPYYASAKFDLVLGGQSVYIARNQAIHNASTNHDSLAVAPYIGGDIDSFANDEELFGPLFAEPEAREQTGDMRQNYDMLQQSGHAVPLSIYEVNLHTTTGSISQQALDAFTPSVGAGLAVADHMLMMMRDVGARDQALFCLEGYMYKRTDGKLVRLWGVTVDMGVANLRRPQYLAVALANEAISGDLVRTTHGGDDPTWNQALVNGVQHPNAHYLQSYAFSSDTGSSVIVFNLSRTSSLDVTFTGPHAPRGTVTMRRLTSASIEDGNETGPNVAVTTQTLPDFDPAQPLSLPPFSMTVLTSSAPVTGS